MLPRCDNQKISIHSLRVEGDFDRFRDFVVKLFQSTPSVWRETASVEQEIFDISFQSTPSVWRETQIVNDCLDKLRFQSTPSVWRETQKENAPAVFSPISIHSLRVEGDNNSRQLR